MNKPPFEVESVGDSASSLHITVTRESSDHNVVQVLFSAEPGGERILILRLDLQHVHELIERLTGVVEVIDGGILDVGTPRPREDQEDQDP